MDLPPAYIVMHTMVGTVAGANARFQQVNSVSAHYGVGLDGHLVQWVDERDAAWHAGNYGVNLDSIGIEHEDGGNYNSPRPTALKQASAQLIAGICKRYHLACNRTVIRLHREIVPTGCPDSLEVDEIVKMAQALIAPAPVPTPVKPEWQQNLKPSAATFQLTKAVSLVDLLTAATVGAVPVGSLSVAYETTVGGKDYWMTLYSVNAGKPNGLLKSDVAAAVAVVNPPADPCADLKTQIADLTKARDDYKAMWVAARAQIAAAVKELST